MTHTAQKMGLVQACRLPQAWSGKAAWRVLEVGGHHGADFLQAWNAWRLDPDRCRMLHYVVIVAGSAPFAPPSPTPHDPLADATAELAQQCWGLLPGIHRLSFDAGQVLLTVCVGDAATFLRHQAWQFDSIFWNTSDSAHGLQVQSTSVKAIARCCATQALLVVRGTAPPSTKDLAECGFSLDEHPPAPLPGNPTLGYRYAPAWHVHAPRVPLRPPNLRPARCLVIGAGLSGASVAASMARRGWQVAVLDAADAPAAGASGLPVGLFAPNLSPDDNLVARISRAGVRATWQQCARSLKSGVDWLASGVLERRPPHKPGMPLGWRTDGDDPHGPAADWVHRATTAQAMAAGLTSGEQAVQHVRAGWIKPARLVNALLAEAGVQFAGHGKAVQLHWQPTAHHDAAAPGLWCALDPDGALLGQAERVVVACGPASNAVLQSAGLEPLPLNAIRGQMSWGLQEGINTLPATPVNGHGALIAQVPVDGGLAWHAGSTFERGRSQLPVPLPEQATGHTQNFENLQALLPAAARTLANTFARGAPALRHWAGVRCTVPDRLPLVGPVAPDTHPGLWVCTGMGARGLSRAVLCGELLAAQMHGEPLPLELRLAEAMAPQRFRPHPA